MRRLFWLAMGVTIGALIVRKLTNAAQKMTPRSIAQSTSASLGELADYVKDFADDVRAAMRDHEVTLREGSGMDGTLGKRSE